VHDLLHATFQNTVDPAKHQTMVLRSGSEHFVFYQCGIFGYQGLYAFAMRQFYKECIIKNVVMAQSRTTSKEFCLPVL
jgi:hypothetical protein